MANLGRMEQQRGPRVDTAIQGRAAWNAGKNVGTKRPLTQKQFNANQFHLYREGRLREKAFFDLTIDSELSGCNLVKIIIGDVVAGTHIRNRTTVSQQKTNPLVRFVPPPTHERRGSNGWNDGVAP